MIQDFTWYLEIKDTFEKFLSDSPLTNQEILHLHDKFNERYNDGVTEAHLAANLLHPSTMGKNLPIALIDRAIDFIMGTLRYSKWMTLTT